MGTFISFVTTAGIGRSEMRTRKANDVLLVQNIQLLPPYGNLVEHRQRVAKLIKRNMAELSSVDDLVRLEIMDRKEAEASLKTREKRIQDLTSQLLDAQEIERKRISLELHDELSQALNVFKFQLLKIEKELREDQGAIQEECGKLRGYVDDVVEDVRRLSLALSPVVLEDIGLTSALRWYIGNLPYNFNVVLNIEEIDHFFNDKHWITIYRIIQEALTNIGKHAQAINVFIDIKRHDDTVIFFIEDDGNGFDLTKTGIKNSSGKYPSGSGLGLVTMNERVKIMGGVLDMWSETKKGTRITFGLPFKNEGA